MSNTNIKKQFVVAVGAAFATSLMGAGAANAAGNPFSMAELPGGYQVADAKGTEGKCGEGKCGSNKASTTSTEMPSKMGEGKCGTTEMSKGKEGQCGAMPGDQKKPTDAK